MNRSSDDEECRLYDRSWERLGKSSESEEGEQRREQFDILERICELKFKYDQALFFHRQTISMRRPHRRLLSDLRDWMSDSDRGNIGIQSCDRKTWQCGEGMEGDLLTFEDSIMDDFTRLVTYTLVDIFHKVTGGRRLGGCLGRKRADQNKVLPFSQADICPTRVYSHGPIVAWTRALTVLLACTLPVGSIIILYSIRDMDKRLGIMAGLTGLFSISMALLTMATLANIFEATAAFAAVLVVFISATNGM